MSYADVTYYKEIYGGNVIPDEQLEGQLEQASDQVDNMTYGRIRAIGFDELTPFQQERVKKAVCVQADFLMQYGEFIDIPLQGFSAGGLSMSFTDEQINGMATSRVVRSLLDQTGLTGRRL